jgi:hypothetical protein
MTAGEIGKATELSEMDVATVYQFYGVGVVPNYTGTNAARGAKAYRPVIPAGDSPVTRLIVMGVIYGAGILLVSGAQLYGADAPKGTEGQYTF